MATVTFDKRTTRGVSTHTHTHTHAQWPFWQNIAAKFKQLQGIPIVRGKAGRQEKMNDFIKKKSPLFRC